MTDDEIFALVLRELRHLLRRLGPLGAKAVLIGGQVLAIEGLRRTGSGIIEATTETGVTVTRGFSFEPDLLLDLEADAFVADQLPMLLREEGYERVRDFRWAKELQEAAPRKMEIDLFRAPELPDVGEPTQMTALPDAELVRRRSVPVEVTLGGETIRLLIPDSVGYLRMKLRAKREQRPNETKDCFDIYAYVQLHGAHSISMQLAAAGDEGRAIRSELKTLFWSTESAGVCDVLASAVGLGAYEAELLGEAVVELFANL